MLHKARTDQSIDVLAMKPLRKYGSGIGEKILSRFRPSKLFYLNFGDFGCPKWLRFACSTPLCYKQIWTILGTKNHQNLDKNSLEGPNRLRIFFLLYRYHISWLVSWPEHRLIDLYEPCATLQGCTFIYTSIYARTLKLFFVSSENDCTFLDFLPNSY